jgi:hypothetical protein
VTHTCPSAALHGGLLNSKCSNYHRRHSASQLGAFFGIDNGIVVSVSSKSAVSGHSCVLACDVLALRLWTVAFVLWSLRSGTLMFSVLKLVREIWTYKIEEPTCATVAAIRSWVDQFTAATAWQVLWSWSDRVWCSFCGVGLRGHRGWARGISCICGAFWFNNLLLCFHRWPFILAHKVFDILEVKRGLFWLFEVALSKINECGRLEHVNVLESSLIVCAAIEFEILHRSDKSL